MLQFNIRCKPGFDASFMPGTDRVRFFNVDANAVPYRVRQKYRNLDYHLIKIRQYSCADIKLYIDNDYVVLIDFTNNHIIFNYPTCETADLLIFHLEQVQQLFRYDRYPETITTMSQYNHYKSLIQNYYGQKERNH